MRLRFFRKRPRPHIEPMPEDPVWLLCAALVENADPQTAKAIELVMLEMIGTADMPEFVKSSATLILTALADVQEQAAAQQQAEGAGGGETSGGGDAS